jgi:hypothetical protein
VACFHRYRSTFSDWVREETSLPSEVREMALAYVIGNKAEAVYKHGDLFEKRKLMAAWQTLGDRRPNGESCPA